MDALICGTTCRFFASMETATINRFQKAAHRLTERFLDSATVLDVRPWAGAGMTEIDLHLPKADMRQWQDVPYVKFRVAPFTYRDYTPFGWDVETSTCSLLIDTGHAGQGSYWASQLKPKDIIQYLKIDFTRQSPHATDMVIGLGDSSSLAHLLALRQLTLPQSRFDGAVVVNNPEQISLFRDYFGPLFTPVQSLQQFGEWLTAQQYCTEHSRFYLTGGNQLVSNLRKELRAAGYGQIRVKGFWD